mmetsp:Transcript_23351/g.57455  ORF Transcript_23351/g.57455 Transcript_23351/m.57455 type:complete len:226 (-) Transcript_23351:328-1005(-)
MTKNDNSVHMLIIIIIVDVLVNFGFHPVKLQTQLGRIQGSIRYSSANQIQPEINGALVDKMKILAPHIMSLYLKRVPPVGLKATEGFLPVRHSLDRIRAVIPFIVSRDDEYWNFGLQEDPRNVHVVLVATTHRLILGRPKIAQMNQEVSSFLGNSTHSCRQFHLFLIVVGYIANGKEDCRRRRSCIIVILINGCCRAFCGTLTRRFGVLFGMANSWGLRRLTGGG